MYWDFGFSRGDGTEMIRAGKIVLAAGRDKPEKASTCARREVIGDAGQGTEVRITISYWSLRNKASC